MERFEPVAQNTGVFGAGMVGMAMMLPNLNFAGANGPQSSQAAGTAGGGGLPSDGSISTAALSLALVPLGLAAVAIFPPFERLVNSKIYSLGKTDTDLCNISTMEKGSLKCC